MSGRQPDIDIAKGLGIFLVAAGHTPLWNSLRLNWIGLAIFAFHMPLFLFLSGLFLPVRRAFPLVLARRAQALLVPWALACLAFLASAPAPRDWGDLLGRIGWATGQSMGWPWTPLWFLPHLFLATLLAWGLVRLWERLGLGRWKWLCLATILLIATRHVLSWEDASEFELFEREMSLLGLPWSLDLLPVSLVWLLSGHLLGPSLRALARPAWSFPLFLGLASLLYWRTGWGMNLNVRTYDHLAGSTLMAVLGILATLSLSVRLSRWDLPTRVLASLGRASLWILVSHCFLQSWIYARLWDEARGPTPDRYLLWGFLAGWLLPWALHALNERLPRLRRPLLERPS